MKYLFGRQECSACAERKAELEATGQHFEYVEFSLDSLNKLRAHGYIALANQAMAIYHEQEETLPVEVDIGD